jgi:hypothetical protein
VRHQLAGDDGDHAVERLRLGGVDALQVRVGVRAPQDGHVEHPGEVDVVDVVAGAADEPVVLYSANAVTDPADLFGVCHLGRAPSAQALAGTEAAAFAFAAAWIAFTMFM